MDKSITPAKFKEQSFNCPICGVYSIHFWNNLKEVKYDGSIIDTKAVKSSCHKCDSEILWWDGSIVAPPITTAPFHHDDMPDEVKLVFEEARSTFEVSPRSSAALLRLCLQILCDGLGYKQRKLDDAIGAMVKNGLSVQVQQALDIVRVVGNNAVHPGQININDNRDTAVALFALINFTVERMISEPKKIDALFQALPEGAREAIHRRDANTTPKASGDENQPVQQP